MLKPYLVSAAAALAIPLGLSSQAFAYADYYGYADYKSGYERVSDSAGAYVQGSVGVAGTSGTLSSGDVSFAYSSGYADAARLKLGIYAVVTSGPLNSYHSSTSLGTAIANSFTVSPGTSGLAVGDPTTLQLTVSLDGMLAARAASYPGAGSGWAEMNAGLTINDSSLQVCDEGCWSPDLASFGASSQLEAYDVYYPFWGYSFAAPWDESWQTYSNLSGYDSFSDSGARQETLASSNGYGETHFFDTGLLTLAFEAIVGHTLNLDADLSTLIQANYDGKAEADFDNTFSFGVSPTGDGVQLAWEIAPETAVPLPGALPLLGSGLLLLVARKRGTGKVNATPDQSC